jgi:tripartite-type tricarboxylate transporter receptor subunit TctC
MTTATRTATRTSTRNRTRVRSRSIAALSVVGLLGLSSACSSVTGAAAGEDGAIDQVEIIVPADPGGGWDQTGRTMQSVLQDNDLVDSAQVVNVGGAGGTVGLAQLANENDPHTLMVMGLVMVGAIETNGSQTTLADTTPIARLTEEAEVVVVPADSPYESITDLLDAIVAEGQGISVAGGSAGGADQILAGLMLEAAGVPSAEIAEKLNYIPFSGGGESLAALLGGKVDAGISGVQEYAPQIAAGELRALAVSGPERTQTLPDAPTLLESGVEVELTNWRGVVAPGSIDEDEAEALTDLVTDMQDTEDWAAALEENEWADAFAAGPEFSAFVDDEVESVLGVLRDIGLVQ